MALDKQGQNRLEKTSEISGNKTVSHFQTISLLKPKIIEGDSLLQAFQLRKTVREISNKKLPLQILSNILWAAYGINRKRGPYGIAGRTAASASNSQEIDIYVALREGTYRFDSIEYKLIPVVSGDLRPIAIGSGQTGVGDKAPVRLIYVADIDKLIQTKGYQEPGLQDPEIQKSYYYVDTGMIAANVYLFACSQGLAAWFHNCNKPLLTTKLKLHANQQVLYAQTIGYPIIS